jgi:hypothetical protein
MRFHPTHIAMTTLIEERAQPGSSRTKRARRRDAKRIESCGERIAPKLVFEGVQLVLPSSVTTSFKRVTPSRKRHRAIQTRKRCYNSTALRTLNLTRVTSR